MIFKAIGNMIADTVLYPAEQPFPKTPKDYGIDYRDVTFPARDWVELSGWLLNEGADKVIIMTHFGYRANRYGYQVKRQPLLTRPYKHEIEFVKVAQRLVDAGYAVLMYDLRNHGESGKSELGVGTGGFDERHDVLGAVEFIASTRGRPIGLLSYCMGANATFFAQCSDPELFTRSNVKAMIAMQPLLNGDFLRAYGIKGSIFRHAEERYKEHTGISLDYPILDHVSKVVTPTLLAQGKKDPWTNLEFIGNLYDAIPVEKEMYWLEEPTHRFDGYNWFGDHPEKMLEWFEAHMS
jgi:alpha-beta hydrolase superfamily lysophospholipase